MIKKAHLQKKVVEHDSPTEKILASLVLLSKEIADLKTSIKLLCVDPGNPLMTKVVDQINDVQNAASVLHGVIIE